MQLTRYIALAITTTIYVAAQIPDFTPPTPLFRAVLGSDAKEVNRVLKSGADPNEGRFLGASALVVALMQHNPAIAKALIDSGADVKTTDRTGSTTLMWAATDETADTTIIKELLRRGVDPNTANKDGDTALTWAMRRGYTPAVELLKEHGASDRRMVRDSVERAVGLLQKSGSEFVKVSGCTSCHHQSLPQMAFAVARTRGVQIDPQIADKQAKTVIAMFKPYRGQMLQGKDNIPDPAISVSYSLLGLGAEGYKPNETTEAMAHLISTQQLPDGSFRSFTARPPMESSAISAAALSLRALQLYGKDPEPYVTKARTWLLTTKPRTTEERAMKLLGLVWAKAEMSDLKPVARSLIAEQRPDGGWAQLPGLESDAYATGQVLTALHGAGVVTVSDDVYNRGAAFLLRTQRMDGSWLVRSRSFPFQPYKESGFPHGKDQWISAAGTSWAVMALSVALPPAEAQVSDLN
jgi:ankyrin repeat protein